MDARSCAGEVLGYPSLSVDNRLKSRFFSGEDFVEPPPKICAGCPIKIPVNSPELWVPLNHSTAKLNAENNGTFYFKIDEIKSATVQVCKLCYKNSDLFKKFI